MDYRIRNLKRVGRGAVVASFDLVCSCGIAIKGWRLIAGNDDLWVSPPQKSFTTDSGEKRYYATVEVIPTGLKYIRELVRIELDKADAVSAPATQPVGRPALKPRYGSKNTSRDEDLAGYTKNRTEDNVPF